MIPVYHATGCGGVAFYFLNEPYEQMPLGSQTVVYADGTSPPHDEQTQAFCGECYEPVEVTDLTTRVLQ